MNRSIGGSRRHLLWTNFWALPCMMIAVTVLATGGLLFADAEGASSFAARQGWPFSMSAKAAQELASGLVTVHAAFATLYFSITLLVLTIAASNLGVRLIDRWISDATIRFTLGLLLSLLSASLIVLMSVHPDQPAAPVPRLSLVLLTAITVLTLAWMSSALHHLGRTVHVDTSIAQLGRDAAASVPAKGVPGPHDLDRRGSMPVLATETGYIDNIDHDRLAAEAKRLGARAGLDRGMGDFVMTGEVIGWTVGTDDASWVGQHLVCRSFRSDTSGPVFEANLLVEVAARALSPAVNDFYTALSCCDQLANMMAAALHEPQSARWWPDQDGVPRLELPRERVTHFMDGPLKALRQAAAPYPSVSIHLIELLGRLPIPSAARDEQLRRFLLRHAAAFADHAEACATLDEDRADLAAALGKAEERLSLSGMASSAQRN